MSSISTINNESHAAVRTKLNNNFSALNTDKLEKGSGVTGNVPTFGASNVLQDSGKTLPSGSVVGTTDTQTLTNKTINGATPTEVGHLSGVTGNIQTQLNGKAASSHAHAASDITSGTMDQARLGSGSSGAGTKFLADDQTYKTVPGGSFKSVTAQHDPSVTGTQDIAHGLGKTPTYVRITALPGGSGAMSIGTYDGTSNICVRLNAADGQNTETVIVYAVCSGGTATAMATVDGTNVTLNWSKTSSPTGNVCMLVEVFG